MLHISRCRNDENVYTLLHLTYPSFLYKYRKLKVSLENHRSLQLRKSVETVNEENIQFHPKPGTPEIKLQKNSADRNGSTANFSFRQFSRRRKYEGRVQQDLSTAIITFNYPGTAWRERERERDLSALGLDNHRSSSPFLSSSSPPWNPLSARDKSRVASCSNVTNPPPSVPPSDFSSPASPSSSALPPLLFPLSFMPVVTSSNLYEERDEGKTLPRGEQRRVWFALRVEDCETYAEE